MADLTAEQQVRAFVEAVYPEMPDLALASLTEQACLTDATELIASLRAERDRLAAECAALREALIDTIQAYKDAEFRAGGGFSSYRHPDDAVRIKAAERELASPSAAVARLGAAEALAEAFRSITLPANEWDAVFARLGPDLENALAACNAAYREAAQEEGESDG